METVLDVHARDVRIKKIINPDVVTMHLLQKRFINKYLFWYAHKEPYTPHDTILERMVESACSASNVHRVVNDNNNPYRNMVMDAMRMN